MTCEMTHLYMKKAVKGFSSIAYLQHNKKRIPAVQA